MNGQLIGWARVSTQSQNLDLQIDALTQAGCHKIFASKHTGKGKGKNIQKIEELIDYVREGDVVVVTKLDRLGRSLREMLSTIDRLKDQGVALKALDQPIDTTQDNAFSNAMLQILGAFAEMERTFIIERVQAGKERTGNYGGRPKTYDDETRAKVVELLHQPFKRQADIARELGVSRQFVSRVYKEIKASN